MRRRGAPRPARGRTALWLAAVAAAALAGWLIGGAGGESPSPSPPAELLREMRAGVPVGFSRTPHGAAAAAAAYQRAFASTAILRPAVLKRRIEAVATPDFAATMLSVNAPGAKRIAAGPIGKGLASGMQTLYAAVPIGYEVESFSPRRARILTWGFTLLGNAASVEPAAYFGLSHTDLLWTRDGWRIAATRSGFGPTPRLATAPGPLGGYAVIDLANHLQSYALVP